MTDISFCVSWGDYVRTVNEKLTHYLKADLFKSNSLEICVDEDVVEKVGFSLVTEEAVHQIKAQIRAIGKDDSGIAVDYKSADFEIAEGSKARYAIITDNGIKVMMVSNLCTKLGLKHPVLDSLFRRVRETLMELVRTECRTENLEQWKHKEDVVKLCIQRSVSNELAFFAKKNEEYRVTPDTFSFVWDIADTNANKTFALSLEMDLFSL